MNHSAPQEQPASGITKPSFWDAIDQFIESVPPAEFKKLPQDGSVNHDHYLYGYPKVDQ